MPIFNIHHITRYEYDRPVKESSNEIKIFPYNCPEQETLLHELNITNSPDVQTFTDYWGNKIGLFSLLPPHKELVIESKLIIRTTTSAQLKINFLGSWNDLKEEVNENLQLLELATADAIEQQEKILEIIASLHPSKKNIATLVESCSNFIFKNFNYIKGITSVETTVDEILAQQAGVCQDFAHVMLQVLRTLHIPSRYVSGYICPNKDGMRGVGATHAWVEAYIPGFGWAGIDPTNNVWVTNNHIKLAVGKNFSDCTPAKGTFKGPARQKLSVFVAVGYEDGHVFEEITNVDLKLVENIKEEVLVDEGFGQQQ